MMTTSLQNGAGKSSASVPAPILVSVVIPAYNCAQYIAETLDSILAQTFTAFEIILVNDGSPDTEALDQVLAPYLAEPVSKLRCIRQPNAGPSAARNRGISEARGKYVAFLDSDDTWMPNHLANQVQLLETDPTLSLVYADSLSLKFDTPVDTAFQKRPQALHVTFETLVAERCTICTSSVVASREALTDAGGFEERRRRSEDFDLWLRLAHRGARMSYSPAVQVRHRAGNGLASDDNLMRRAQIDVYEKALLTLPITGPQAELLCRKTQEIQSRLHTEIAREALRQGRFPEAFAAAKLANTFQRSAKLAVVLAGLRWFPNLLRSFYCLYEKWLQRGQTRRQARFQAGWNGTPERKPRVDATEKVIAGQVE
jgi:glycosyltransferase involved in cell wall biosynthesis